MVPSLGYFNNKRRGTDRRDSQLRRTDRNVGVATRCHLCVMYKGLCFRPSFYMFLPIVTTSVLESSDGGDEGPDRSRDEEVVVETIDVVLVDLNDWEILPKKVGNVFRFHSFRHQFFRLTSYLNLRTQEHPFRCQSLRHENSMENLIFSEWYIHTKTRVSNLSPHPPSFFYLL